MTSRLRMPLHGTSKTQGRAGTGRQMNQLLPNPAVHPSMTHHDRTHPFMLTCTVFSAAHNARSSSQSNSASEITQAASTVFPRTMRVGRPRAYRVGWGGKGVGGTSGRGFAAGLRWRWRF